MPQTQLARPKTKEPASYSTLIKRVREALARGRERAAQAVERELKSSPEILITSAKSDKYGRYLADVFYENKTGEQFLNNRLLQARLAVRV